MLRKMFSLIAITAMICLLMHVTVVAEGDERFDDVPADHWSDTVVHQLRDLGITNGVSKNEFGIGREITRSEFVTFLVRLKGWDTVTPQEPTYPDVMIDDWFYGSIETAAANGVLDGTDSGFRPTEAITREEMAIMIVNALGYGHLAELYNDQSGSYTDVTENIGYIELLQSFGIVNGKGDGIFAPLETAKREEAAAILIRMYNKINNELEGKNAFYAISSYSQMTEMAHFSSVSFGWASLSYDEADDALMLMDQKPVGYEEPLGYAAEQGAKARLSVLASDSTKTSEENIGIITLLLEDNTRQDKLIDDIIETLASEDAYEGVVIDFEDMVSAELQTDYVKFLVKLKERLESSEKTLTVMVQPDLYYKGYDYKGIGEIADEVIIMAHDYSTRQLTEVQQKAGYTFTPAAPLQQVYDTLVALTDPETGVQDRQKISLQLSLSSVQWAVNSDQSVYNDVPYQPTYDMIYKRVIQDDTIISYNEYAQSPKAEYYNADTELNYVIWYEDSRSIAAKIDLAKMFDINQISVWRLGNIPAYDASEDRVYMNVLDTIIESN